MTTFTLNCAGRLLYASEPLIMGILNATPDSFFTKGKHNSIQGHIDLAGSMIEQGAAIIDIGGMSTRPGSIEISKTEELDRVLPVVEAVRKQYPNSFISVDTYRAVVAKQAVLAGADMVNDISAGELDKEMFATVAQAKVPYIAMHMQGTPQTMQIDPSYQNVTEEVLNYFVGKTNTAQAAGINDLIIDPGFGFGKTVAHNYALLKNMNVLAILQKPLLVGVSRKSMVTKLLHVNPENALNGTSALHMLALQQGASILRVHDVLPAVECLKIYQYYQTI